MPKIDEIDNLTILAKKYAMGRMEMYSIACNAAKTFQNIFIEHQYTYSIDENLLLTYIRRQYFLPPNL